MTARRARRKRGGGRLVASILLFALIGGTAGLYVILWAPNSFDGERIITVSKGDSFAAIEDTLVSAGVIRNRLLFNLAARILGSDRKMQIGRYRFRPGMSNSRILEDLEFGKSAELVSVTVPEGIRTRRVAAIFGRNLGLDVERFEELAGDTGFIGGLGLDAVGWHDSDPASGSGPGRASGRSLRSLEGYLLPGTYHFYWQEPEETVLAALAGAFLRFFDDSLRAEAARRSMSVHQVLTLASIIEAETAVDSERTRIAGVYHNRLRKRMRLQADPTVQYLLEDGPRRLTYSDLNRPSPYNTYRNPGLPPGPINNPGKASILAALSPERHNYYFFVASGEGGHNFSKTYAEHLRQVRLYQRRRAEAAREREAAAAAAAAAAADSARGGEEPSDSTGLRGKAGASAGRREGVRRGT